MIPAGYAADLKAARPFECEASAAPGTSFAVEGATAACPWVVAEAT